MKKTILFEAEALNELESGIKNYQINLLTSLKNMLPAGSSIVLVMNRKTKNLPREFASMKILQLYNPLLDVLYFFWRKIKQKKASQESPNTGGDVNTTSANKKSLIIRTAIVIRSVITNLLTPHVAMVRMDAKWRPSRYCQIFSFSDWLLPGVQKIMIVHDLTPFIMAEHHDKGHRKFMQFLFDKIAQSRYTGEIKFLSVSESTQRDLQTYFPKISPDRMAFAYNGVDYRLKIYLESTQKSKNTLKKFGLEGSYIMGLGTIEPRKNLRTLIKAFALFQEKHPEFTLVLTGKKGWDYSFDDFFHSLPQKVQRQIKVTGHLERTEVFDLLKNADVFVYPSLYEGFGLPVLEAMALETPVITSANSSLPEVLGPQGVYLQNEQDADQLNKLMEKVLFSPDFDKAAYIRYQKDRTKMFDWDNVSRKLLSWLPC